MAGEAHAVGVYVSSTWLDLQPEREAVRETLARFAEAQFVGMEFFGSRDDDTRAASLQDIARCRLYVCILGDRFGSGITRDEYREARRLGLDCHAYVKATPKVDAVDAADWQAFRRELEQAHLVSEFAEPYQLAMLVAADLHRWLTRRLSTPLEQSVPIEAPAGLPAAEERRALDLLAERVRVAWVSGVLDRMPLRLALEAEVGGGLVSHPLQRYVQAPDRPAEALAPGVRIIDAFEAQHRSLLIVGAPGCGKTTTLLELTRDLLELRKGDASQPVPVVFNLSGWKASRTEGLAGWLAVEFHAAYGVPSAMAQRWLAERRVLILLDGLDEVAAACRPQAVEAINAFARQLHVPGIAVTCRLEECLALPVRLELFAAVSLRPLSDAQIAFHLDAIGERGAALRAALDADPALAELARLPLLLELMTAARAGSARSPGRPNGEAGGAAAILADYIDVMFRSRATGMTDDDRQGLRRTLAWLARRMQAGSMSAVAIDRLSPALLGTRAARWAYLLASRGAVIVCMALPLFVDSGSLGDPFVALLAVSALAGSIAVDVGAILRGESTTSEPGWTSGAQRLLVHFGVSSLVLLCLLLSLGDTEAQRLDVGSMAAAWAMATTSLLYMSSYPALGPMGQRGRDGVWSLGYRWRFSSAMRGAIGGFILVFTLEASACAAWSDDYAEITRHGARYGVVGLVVGFLFGGIQPRVPDALPNPGSALRRALRDCIVAAALGGMLGWACQRWLGSIATFGTKWLSLYAATLAALWFGGGTLIQHATLRLVLRASCGVPLRWTRWLEEARRLALMRVVGGSHMFVHRMLLDHFADLERAPAGR